MRIGAGMLAAALTLSGCFDGIGPSGDGDAGGTFFTKAFAKAPKSVRVVDRQVKITGPDGFCIDKSALTNSRDGAFVLLGSCAAISQNPRDAYPKVPAVLTASVAPDQADAPFDPVSYQSFVRSNAGRAALSRSGDPTDLTILKTQTAGDALLIQADDRSGTGPATVSNDHWRAFFAVNGYLVTVTVTGFASRPLSDASGLALTKALVAAISGRS